MDEQALVRKLVTTWHLNVAERSALPHRTAKASLACQAIVDVLSGLGWFPPNWRPDEGFDGGLIQYTPSGKYDIHWKVEVGLMRFELERVDHYSDALEAARAWLGRMFPNDIDGVRLDWTA